MNFFNFSESILKCNGQITIMKLSLNLASSNCRNHLTLKGLDDFDLDEKHEKNFIPSNFSNNVIHFNFNFMQFALVRRVPSGRLTIRPGLAGTVPV